ncbi:MAG: Clp protease N-terminal domain-containing protein, partial [Bdellovibrionales bacterium]
MIDFNKVTKMSQEAIQAAARLAEDSLSPQLEPDHLIFELIRQDEGIVPQVLSALNITSTDPIIRALTEKLKELPQISSGQNRGQLGASQGFL